MPYFILLVLIAVVCVLSFSGERIFSIIKHKEEIQNFTPKVFIHARPYSNNLLIQNISSIKYDVYVINNYQAYKDYIKMENKDSSTAVPKNSYELSEIRTMYLENCIDSSYDTLEHAKERARKLKEQILSPNAYSLSKEFNANEIKKFNDELNS